MSTICRRMLQKDNYQHKVLIYIQLLFTIIGMFHFYMQTEHSLVIHPQRCQVNFCNVQLCIYLKKYPLFSLLFKKILFYRSICFCQHSFSKTRLFGQNLPLDLCTENRVLFFENKLEFNCFLHILIIYNIKCLHL